MSSHAETTAPALPEAPRWRRALRWVGRWTVRSVMLGGVLGAVGGFFAWRWFDAEILSTLPDELGRNADFRFPCSVQVFDAAGARVDAFYLERRVWVPIDDLPEHVWRAFVASEDRRFFEHRGVDPIGIARALVVNLRGGETRQGGSTITQQLVKNLLVGKERSYRRKLREAVLAYRLDDELDKMQLLELYINYIALGSGNYGVEAAAQDYFGVSARDLDVGQAAMLAGLVPAPSRYSPRHDAELAAQRRETVLKLMVQQGHVSAAEASQHLTDPVVVPRTSADKGKNAAYLTETRREIRRLFGSEVAYLEGLQVQTPLDSRVQSVTEQAVKDGLDALEARQGARGPVRRIPDDKRAGFLARGDGLRIDPQTGTFRAPRADECFLALADDASGSLSAGPFVFALAAEDLATRVRTGPGKPAAALSAVLQRGDVLDVCAAGAPTAPAPPTPVTLVHRRKRPWAESAAVVIENATGHIVALAGGYDVGLEGFVRATQAKRQPGSSFKPFVYAAALASGMRQTEVVVDAPFSVLGTNGLPWSPRNYDGKYHGPILLRKALALSLNTVAVRLAHTTGIEAVTTLATRLGVRTPLRNDLTVALGSSEITPMDVALGYSSLARMGVHIDPVWITSVADRRGRVLGTEGAPLSVPGAPATALPGGPGTRAMDAGTAYVMVDMMRNVFHAGTAKKGQREGMDFGGKTGTTSGFVDAWFVGFSPRYTVAVWVGTDGTASIGDKETGGKAALPVWSAIMEALPNVPGERFPVPDEVLLLPAPEGTVGSAWLSYVRGTAPDDLLQVPPLTDGAMLPPFGGAYPIAGATGIDGAEAAPAPLPPDVVVAETLPDDADQDVEEGAADPVTGWPRETVLDGTERPSRTDADDEPGPRALRDPFAGALTAYEPPATATPAPAAPAAPKVVKAPPETSRKAKKRPRKKRRGG